MNHKILKQLLGVLLAFVMVIGLIPASTLTALAASPTEITELSFSFRDEDDIPAVGDPIIYRFSGAVQENDDRVVPTASGLIWHIDNSAVAVNDTFDDRGMYFEAGRSYNATFVVKVVDPDMYSITENTVITMTNPGDFTYTAKVTEITNTGNNVYAHICMTVTMNGQRTYPDITKVVFEDFCEPSEGVSPIACDTDIYYNNCQMTSGTWHGDVWENNTFVAGETYTYRVELTAREGYKFHENVAVLLTNSGVIKSPTEYEFSNNYKTLTLEYSYTIPTITWLESVDAIVVRYYQDLTPISGESAEWLFKGTFEVDENGPYEIIGEQDRSWYSEDGTQMKSGDYFEAGNTYYFEYAFSIKNEYEHLYRFNPENLRTTITGESYSGKGFQKAERIEDNTFDNTYVRFRYYFTAQFPDGAGSSASFPAFCSSYNEFKYAMENPDVRYVALANANDMLPTIPHNEELEPDGVVANAIVVRGKKDLLLAGDSTFTCPISNNYDVKSYTDLLVLSDVYNADLYIHGSGSLTFNSSYLDFYYSAIKVIGGKLCVDGATIIGSHGNHDGFCYGINAVYGQVIIQGGATIRGGVYDGSGVCALSLGDEVLNASLSVNILDGNFYVDRVHEGGYTFGGEYIPYEDHGIWVLQEDIGLRIYGATMDGFRLRPEAQSHNLGDFVQDGCTTTVDGVKVDPANYGTIDGKIIKVYHEISDVDIHINDPVADGDIPFYVENVYGVPDDCIVQRVTWFEDGGDISTSQFIAGKSYKVEIAIATDEGVKFATPLTSATINFKNAAVTAQVIGAEYGIILTYDFGACPATISDIELTIDPPKQNGIPDQSVTCGNSTYKQAPAGVNMFDSPLQWQESSNGQTWTIMDLNDTFTVGYYYRVYIDVMPLNGYEFALDPHLDPNVSATVNGYYATVSRYPEANPDELISVCYDFGQLNDNIIEQIDIGGVAEPVVGEEPNYNCAISGTGYTINTSYDNGTYVKNGICWRDVTDDKWVYPSDTFQIGHQYKVFVDVKTENGYEFYTTSIGSSYKPVGWGYINDNYATLGVQSDARFEQTLSWTFTCGPKTVNSIAVYDLVIPVDGSAPDFTALTDSEYYTVDSIVWYDIENNIMEMTESDSFISGNTYYALITVVPSEENSNNLCKFIQGKTVATLNSVPVTKINGDSWQEVSSTINYVRIYYTFTCKTKATEYSIKVTNGTASAENATVTKAIQGSAVTLKANKAPSGQVFDKWVIDGATVFNVSASTTIFIMPAGNVTATATYKDIPIETYTVSFTANGGSGTMSDVNDVSGEYTLPACGFTAPTGKQFKAWRVGNTEKAVGDKIEVNGDTTITAVWEDVPAISLYGDVNKDGKVNNIDATYVLRYSVGGLTEEQLAKLNMSAGDVKLDGKINNIDATIILRYSVGSVTKLPYVS